MADYLETVPQEAFSMHFFRDDVPSHDIQCKSVGCAIGHCVHLDPNPDQIPRCPDGSIDFMDWSFKFTGIMGYDMWSYLFSSVWYDLDNTPKGAAARIRYVVENRLPKTFSKEMDGRVELSYK